MRTKRPHNAYHRTHLSAYAKPHHSEHSRTVSSTPRLARTGGKEEGEEGEVGRGGKGRRDGEEIQGVAEIRKLFISTPGRTSEARVQRTQSKTGPLPYTHKGRVGGEKLHNTVFPL